ncbi:hypothetical protein DH86_00003990, partial [Scytalidium sp. 3C]
HPIPSQKQKSKLACGASGLCCAVPSGWPAVVMEPPSLSRDAGHNAPSIRPEKSVRSSVSRTARTASAGESALLIHVPSFLCFPLLAALSLPSSIRRETHCTDVPAQPWCVPAQPGPSLTHL